MAQQANRLEAQVGAVTDGESRTLLKTVSFAYPGRGPLQDRAARSYLDSGDAPAVEHYEPVAVFAAQYPAIFCQGRDDELHNLVRGGAPHVVGDVQVVAADEADPQHDLCHGPAP